ncbi:MAG: hypothetical protein ACI30A_05230 [Paludibacteraceae bacterium]
MKKIIGCICPFLNIVDQNIWSVFGNVCLLPRPDDALMGDLWVLAEKTVLLSVLLRKKYGNSIFFVSG